MNSYGDGNRRGGSAGRDRPNSGGRGRPSGPSRGPGGSGRGGPGGSGRPSGGGRRPSSIGLRELGRGEFELVHPKIVYDLMEDYHEGIELWRAGEPEDAVDALRYALEGCGDFAWAHVALGRIALEVFQDPSLARGHFGYVVELIERTIPPGFRGRLPRDLPGNAPFFDAVDGLVECLRRLGRAGDAVRLRDDVDRLMGKRKPPEEPGRERRK